MVDWFPKTPGMASSAAIPGTTDNYIFNYDKPTSRFGVGPTAAEISQDMSFRRGDREQLFRQGLAANPFINYITPRARGTMARRFDPYSASYTLRNILSGTEGANIGPVQPNFRQFMNEPTILGPTDYRSQIRHLSNIFETPEPTLEEEARMGALSGDYEDQARNILIQAMSSGLNPLLRNTASDVLGRRFTGFRDRDPTTPLWAEFAPQVLKYLDRVTGV